MSTTHISGGFEITGDFNNSGAITQGSWSPVSTTLGLMNGTASAAGKLVIPSQGLNFRSATDAATIASLSNTGAWTNIASGGFTGAPGSGSGAGGALPITGGVGGATGAGGAASLTGGAGGATSGTGGAASVVGGAGTAGNSAGGVASVTGGAGQGTANGGAATVTGGAGGGGATGNGGAATITGGAATSTNGTGGAASLIGGAGTGNGAGGAITITSGAAGATGVAGAVNISVGAATAGNGSNVTITGGNGAGGTAAGGNVNIIPGTAVSTGVPGEFQINSSTAGITPVVYNYTASLVTQTFFVASRAYRVKDITGRVRVQGSGGACTLQVFKVPSGTAVGSGTVLHSGSYNLVGTVDTNQQLTLSSTVATVTLAAGDGIGYVLTGTATSAVGNITVTLVPV